MKQETMQRYSRQIAFDPIGKSGQEKLLASRAAIVGMGALGTVAANHLCRSGVGFLRLIDRDFVEISNLQRQMLYDETDAAAGVPKAIAACAQLSKANAQITLEPIVADVNSSNIERLIGDVDIILDGSDNHEVRHLINEACFKLKKPWVYGGAIAGIGAAMNILFGEGPCLKCLSPQMPPPGSHPTCSSAGILSMATGIIASFEAAEAIKILIGAKEAISRKYLSVDIWNNAIEYIDVVRNPDCPLCGQGRFELLGKNMDSDTTTLCGQDAIQIIPRANAKIDLAAIAQKLAKSGKVDCTQFILHYEGASAAFSLFPDGRAIIKNIRDGAEAKGVYAEYVGL